MASQDLPSTQDLLMDEPSQSHQFLEEQSKESSEARPFDPKNQLPWPKEKGHYKNLKAKNWFLTFPQCQTTKELALQRLQQKFKDNLLGCLIAQESHEDGE